MHSTGPQGGGKECVLGGGFHLIQRRGCSRRDTEMPTNAASLIPALGCSLDKDRPGVLLNVGLDRGFAFQACNTVKATALCLSHKVWPRSTGTGGESLQAAAVGRLEKQKQGGGGYGSLWEKVACPLLPQLAGPEKKEECPREILRQVIREPPPSSQGSWEVPTKCLPKGGGMSRGCPQAPGGPRSFPEVFTTPISPASIFLNEQLE